MWRISTARVMCTVIMPEQLAHSILRGYFCKYSLQTVSILISVSVLIFCGNLNEYLNFY